MIQGEQTRGVRARLGGYAYECNIAALRLIDLLAGRASSVTLERQFGDSDHLDDIKVFADQELHAYQVKWGMRSQEDIDWEVFSRPKGEDRAHIGIASLITAHQTLRQAQPECRSILHFYTTRRFKPGDSIHELVLPAKDPKLIRFADNPNDCYIFDGKKVALLLPDLDSSELKDLLENLVIEIGQPQMPADPGPSSEVRHPIQELAIFRLRSLGIADPPARLDPAFAYDRLVQLSIQHAIYGTPLNLSALESYLGIDEDRGSIPQDFPYEDKRAVHSPLGDHLLNLLTEPDKRRIVAVVGPPGSGKSWGLTQFSRDYNPDRPIPIHYCFERPQDDPYANQRTTSETAIANLLSSIRRFYPGLSCFAGHYYGNTPWFLEQVLQCLARETKESVVPIIIDGLDHVSRKVGMIAIDDEDASTVLDLLMHLSIPDGVIFIVGTQPVRYLDRLSETRGDEFSFIEMPPLDERRVAILMEMEGIPLSSLSDAGRVTALVTEISHGLPLYVHYVSRFLAIVDAPSDDSIDAALQELPQLHEDRDIAAYYEYLWGTYQDIAHGLLLRFVVLDFFVTQREMEEEIFSANERIGQDIEGAWRSIRPLLHVEEHNVSVFHDSFRQFGLKKLETLGQPLINYMAIQVKNFLGKEPFFESDRAFRYLWRYMRTTGSQEDVCSQATLEMVDEALTAGRTLDEVRAVLLEAAQAAAEMFDFPAAARIGVLLAYLPQRYANLPSVEFASALGALERSVAADRYLRGQLRSLSQPNEVLSILDRAGDEGWSIEGESLVDRLHRKLESAPKEQLQNLDFDLYVKVLARWLGGRTTVSWIQKRIKPEYRERFVGGVYMDLSDREESDELRRLARAARSQPRRAALNCLLYIANGNLELVDQALFQSALPILRDWDCVRLADRFANAHIHHSIFAELVPVERALFVSPERITSLDEEKVHLALRTTVRVWSVVDSQVLANIRNWLNTMPLSYLRAYSRLAIEVGIVQGQLDTQIHPKLDPVLDALRDLVLWQDTAGVRPRLVDLFGLTADAIALSELSFTLVLVHGSRCQIESFAAFMSEQLEESIIAEQMVDDMPRAFAFIEGALRRALAFELPDEAIDAMRTLCGALEDYVRSACGYETVRSQHFLGLASLWTYLGERSKGEACLTAAIQASFAHGWRKDGLLFSVGDAVKAVNQEDPAHALERLRRLGGLISWIDRVTDGDETRHLPAYLFDWILPLSTPDAIFMLRQFELENNWRAYNNCLHSVLAAQNLSPTYKCLLASTIVDEADTSSIACRAMIEALREHRLSGGRRGDWMHKFVEQYVLCGIPAGPPRDRAAGGFASVASCALADLGSLDIPKMLEEESAEGVPAVTQGADIALDGSVENLVGQQTISLINSASRTDSEHRISAELGRRFADGTPQEFLEWLEAADERSPHRVLLAHHAARALCGSHPGEAIQCLLDAYHSRWGWTLWAPTDSWDLILQGLKIDANLMMGEIVGEFARRLRVEGSVGHVGFSTLIRVLVASNKLETAIETLDEIFRVVNSMFRTFAPIPNSYEWLGYARTSALPEMPVLVEHEILIRRLLAPELDKHYLSAAAVQGASEVVPGFVDSLISSFPQLTSTHSRTTTLSVLGTASLTGQQLRELVRHLEGEERLPILVEAIKLGLTVKFPSYRPTFLLTAPRRSDEFWRALMPLAQSEFRDLSQLLGEDWNALRDQFLQSLFMDDGIFEAAREFNRRFLHPGGRQIVFESFELRALLDELYRFAASRYKLLDPSVQDLVRSVVTHDDSEIRTPAFGCSPLMNTQELGFPLASIVDGEAWIPAAFVRMECSVSAEASRTERHKVSYFALGAAPSTLVGNAALRMIGWCPRPRATLAEFRELAANEFIRPAYSSAVAVGLDNFTLVSKWSFPFSLNPELRQDLGLSWGGHGLDLYHKDRKVAGYVRWRVGLEADVYQRRRWEDEGWLLAVAPDFLPILQEWSSTPISGCLSTHVYELDWSGDPVTGEDEVVWSSKLIDLPAA